VFVTVGTSEDEPVSGVESTRFEIAMSQSSPDVVGTKEVVSTSSPSSDAESPGMDSDDDVDGSELMW
jgi:hypothetical protein